VSEDLPDDGGIVSSPARAGAAGCGSSPRWRTRPWWARSSHLGPAPPGGLSGAGWATEVEIQRLAVAGWIALAQGKTDDVLKLMRAAGLLQASPRLIVRPTLSVPLLKLLGVGPSGRAVRDQLSGLEVDGLHIDCGGMWIAAGRRANRIAVVVFAIVILRYRFDRRQPSLIARAACYLSGESGHIHDRR